ncbi:MAG: peptidase C1 [Pseudomonadota bacterium]
MFKQLVRSAILLSLTLATAPAAADGPRDPATWIPLDEDAVIKELKNREEARVKADTEATDAIRAALAAKAAQKKDARKDLRSALAAGSYPASTEIFSTLFHFPPQAQFMTGTCWSFGATSFIESEVKRLSGAEVKLAELYPVYWEYVEKAREFIWTRGGSTFSEGSQLNSVTRMYAKYGAVPLEAYKGVMEPDGRHDHQRLFLEMSDTLEHFKTVNRWDEDLIIKHIRDILDRHLGAPPETFTFKGKTYTPKSFLETVLRIDPDAYVQFMSTTLEPMWAQAEFAVTDNWWHDTTYWNVPLEDFYRLLPAAVQAGFTAGIGGDVSEPGKVPELDIAFIPSWDIPSDFIDQDAREYRIWNHSTGDDHGVHLVGYKRLGDHDWFLIKDSGHSARKGRHQGYYFFRDDFIKLKMLTVMVHKDAAKALLDKIAAEQQPKKVD